MYMYVSLYLHTNMPQAIQNDSFLSVVNVQPILSQRKLKTVASGVSP